MESLYKGLQINIYHLFNFHNEFQVAGGCWYILAIQRVASCIRSQCETNNNCELMSSVCSKEVQQNNATMAANQNLQTCLNGNGPFPFGIYDAALPVISSNSLAVKILYPIFWGLMTLR